MNQVKRTSSIFIGPDGKKHHPSKDAIVIDLTTRKSLVDLLEEAYKLQKEQRK